MKSFSYVPSGVCSRLMTFDLDDQLHVHNLVVQGGCNGNLKGIASLSENQSAAELVKRLSGIRCGMKNTSCPDQFAKALEKALQELA